MRTNEKGCLKVVYSIIIYFLNCNQYYKMERQYGSQPAYSTLIQNHAGDTQQVRQPPWKKKSRFDVFRLMIPHQILKLYL